MQNFALTGNRKQPQESKSQTGGKESSRKEKKSEKAVPLVVPAIEVSSETAVVSSSVDGVESTPEVATSTGNDKVPEIKVVQPSPEMKTKSKRNESESEEEETQSGKTEEKVEETGEKNEEQSKEPGRWL